MINRSSYLDGIIYKTTNSGVNWFQSRRGGFDYYDIKFKDAMTGYCIWSSVIKTTNAGNSWNYFGEVNAVTFSITSSFNDTLYMSGDSGKVYRSINAGANWIKFYTPSNDTLKKIYFVNSKTGYATGDGGVIIKTTNAGVNWSLQNSNTTKKLNSIWFINKDTGFAVGDSGVVLKTYTGGLVSISNNITEIPNKFYLYQNYPNPFNPTTIISYNIPISNKGLQPLVKLKVYDVLGSEVTLVNQKQSATGGAGIYEVEFDGSNFPSGIYFYKLEIGDFFSNEKDVIN